MYAIYSTDYEQRQHTVLLSEDQKHLVDEIIFDEYSYRVFYDTKRGVVRDGDDGVYLSEAAQSLIRSLKDDSTVETPPVEATSFEIEILF